ncbi:hypothetical protein CFC21_050303 [Triticum aestivum]|uniref:Uncharacterized protein n=2 Tax=Triticum aestivum TaxID=4565 RepID=A0A9R1K4C9_WHEAT|nr:hypothetical protein CFC21_050303 [Triticum aestivum]
MHVGTYVLLADPCYACMAMVRSTSSCMPINGSRLALLWSSYFNVSEKLRRAAGQRGGPDDLQDLDHLGHGRPVGRDLRRAHHAQLQHRQRLLLRELAAQRRVHQSLRRGVVVPTAPLLQRHTHLVCQHGHVVLPVLHRAPPRHQLQHQHAEPVHVALLVHPQAAARQLRRRVPHGRALHEPAAAHRAHAAVAVRLLLLLLRLPEQPRQPEVGDQRVAPRVQQDVARLQVVVDHRRPERLVQVGQGVAGEVEEAEGGQEGEAGAEGAGEVVAGEGERLEAREAVEAAGQAGGGGEGEAVEREAEHAGGGWVALHVRPAAGRGVGLGPRGEGAGGVREGGAEHHQPQHLLVHRLRQRVRVGRVRPDDGAEQQQEEEEHGGRSRHF